MQSELEMNCEDVQGWLWGSPQADLERGDASDSRMHIDRCPSCTAAERETRSFDACVRAAVLSEIVDDRSVREEVLGRIRARGRRLPDAVLRVAAAALLTVAALLAWTAFRGSTPLETMALRHHRKEVLGHERQVWISDPSTIARLLAERVDAPPANASRVVAHGGVRAARLCRLGGKPQVHLLVDAPEGAVSLFISRDPAPNHVVVAPFGGTSDGLRSVAITSNHLAVIVVGPVTDREATRLAREMWSTLAV